nr:adenylate/guanylate cyclase domain-containing protein [Mycolicibacterium komossense]
MPVRNEHYADSAARRYRVLKITTWIAAVVSGGFGIWQLLGGYGTWPIGVSNVATGVVFLLIPLLAKFGELVAPLAFIVVAYASVFFICWQIGTGSGLQFYLLVSASILVLVLGVERIALAGILAGVGAVLVIVLEVMVPSDTGLQPAWTLTIGFITSVLTASVMAFATVWFAMRETARAEVAMEGEYQRSETLLSNMLPASIATRLKDPTRDRMIADRYDDASILFADIAGFTERASDTAPCDLVAFLDQLYTAFDLLVDRHGLEKVKTSGDSYMVVSGVPIARPDHLQALAALALDMSEVAATLRDPTGRLVPMRIGIAAGPVVAGVVGSRRFFYDVWGDAVNVASRMESTDQEGRIQVPDAVYQRLKSQFFLEERGDVVIKGKGVMHTWYLVGPREGGGSVQVQTPVRKQVDVLGQ